MTATTIAREQNYALPVFGVFEPTDGMMSAAYLVRLHLSINPYWIAWVAAYEDDYPNLTPEGQVKCDENREMIEEVGPVNRVLQMPFCLLTTTEWSKKLLPGQDCTEDTAVELLVQAKAESRGSHSESYRTFTHRLNQMIAELIRSFRENRTYLQPAFGNVDMITKPTRVKIDMNDQDNDVWVAAFVFSTEGFQQ